MESAWPLDDADRAAIAAGGEIILRVIGRGHPPVMLYVDEIGAPTDQNAVHNDAAGRITGAIVRSVFASGGSVSDVMVLTESVRRRLAEIRLGNIEPQGSA